MDSLSFVWQLIVALVSAGAVYGAIRADLRNLHRRVDDVKETADQAHSRIDDMLLRPRTR